MNLSDHKKDKEATRNRRVNLKKGKFQNLSIKNPTKSTLKMKNNARNTSFYKFL